MIIKDSRQDFNKTWLIEMPQNIGVTNLFDNIVYSINERIQYGSTVVEIKKDFKKIEGHQTVFYWYENNGDIILAAELTKLPQALVVNAIGKKFKNSFPCATDLCIDILEDRQNLEINSILLSDIQLSEEGFKIWKKLLDKNHKISVYDSTNPTATFNQINDPADFDKYFGKDNNYKRWQFILSENSNYGELKTFFNTKRMRELSGMDVI